MPSSIPYDPSLVLGNIVDKNILDRVVTVSNLQAEADSQEQRLNDLIALKRSLDMTLLELMQMQSFQGTSTESDDKKSDNKTQDAEKDGQTSLEQLKKQLEDVKAEIYKAAVNYATVKSKVLHQIADVNSGGTGDVTNSSDNKPSDTKEGGGKSNPAGMVHYSMESPIDYARTTIKKMPLAADSLKLNSQYFSYEENKQDSQTMAATIKSYVSGSIGGGAFGIGRKASGSLAVEASRQAHHQYENHSIVGTLVITISCTHKDAALLSPLVLDVDKAVKSWNGMFKDDQIDTSNPQAVAALLPKKDGSKGEGEAGKSTMEVISGATYGSSFVAMVHILDVTETQAREEMNSIASQIQAQASGGWLFASVSGGFGLDASYSNALKSLISNQSVQSHCNIVTMGSIPSIKANDIKLAVQKFAQFDPAESMSKLAQLQNAGANSLNSMGGSIDAARTGNDMVRMEAAKVESVMTALDKTDERQNKILDINSVMNAMDDYIEKALAGNLGVPVNYYLESITKDEIARKWIDKYYPFMDQSQDSEEKGSDDKDKDSGDKDKGSGTSDNKDDDKAADGKGK